MARFINPFTDVGFKYIFGQEIHNSDKMRLIFLQLPCFQKTEVECENDFERWIYKLQRMPFKLRKAVFQRLEDIVDIASLSKEDRIKYDESIKVYRDNLVTEAYAREQGRVLGHFDVARKMKAKGAPVELIADYTGLTIDEINEIQAD